MTDGLKPGWRRVKFGEVVRLSKESSKDPAADGLERAHRARRPAHSILGRHR